MESNEFNSFKFKRLTNTPKRNILEYIDRENKDTFFTTNLL